MFRTPAFEAFIAPARHYPEIWRILVGFIVAITVYLLPILLIFTGIGLLYPGLVYEVQTALEAPDTPRAMFVLLATFLFMGLGAQTGAEELLFRGYLMQALAARFKSAIIWMGIPTVLFGLAHYNGALDPKLTVLLICATGLFGLVAADLTRITGNLGAAVGFHFTNNFFALFLVSIEGEMSGLSLYTAPFTMQDVETLIPLIIIDMVTVVLAWSVLRRWLAPA